MSRISPTCIRRSTATRRCVEADRCYFCYDAPCIAACPTGDRHPAASSARSRPAIRTARPRRSSTPNIMGGMCARVCPTEMLCEEACVREAAEGKPVKIGAAAALRHRRADRAGRAALPRARADRASASRSSAPGRRALPARTGSRCSATTVTLFEARDQAGGLNEYGIAAYKTPDDFAAARGRLHPRRSAASRSKTGSALGRDFTLAELRGGLSTRSSSAIGLGGVNALGARGRGARGRRGRGRASSRELRQAADLGELAGRPARRRDRRRHDGDRRRDAGQAPRRRGRDHRLPPRRGAR